MSTNTVRLWDLTDPGRPRRLPTSLTGYLAGSAPDGRLVAMSGSEELYEMTTTLWDLTDPAHPRRYGPPLNGHNRFVDSVVFAPDSRTVAVVADHGTVTLWDVTDPDRPGRLDAELPGNTEYVSLVAFAPDQRTLVTDNAAGEVLLWDLTELNDVLNDPVAMACAIVEQGFGQEEWALRIPGIPYQDSCAT
jgi:WD40 repeat protein